MNVYIQPTECFSEELEKEINSVQLSDKVLSGPYAQLIHTFLKKYHEHHQYEDLLQTAICAIPNIIKKYDNTKSSFSYFLKMHLKNVCTEFFRRNVYPFTIPRLEYGKNRSIVKLNSGKIHNIKYNRPIIFKTEFGTSLSAEFNAIDYIIFHHKDYELSELDKNNVESLILNFKIKISKALDEYIKLKPKYNSKHVEIFKYYCFGEKQKTLRECEAKFGMSIEGCRLVIKKIHEYLNIHLKEEYKDVLKQIDKLYKTEVV